MADRLQLWRVWRTKSSDISEWGLAEQAAVFTVKLTGAFVPDFKRRTCGVQAVHQHSAARSLQTKLFLILQRTHRGQFPKMMVECRNTHACNGREIFHSNRFCVVRLNPGNGLRRALAVISQRRNCAEPRPFGSLQNAVDDFSLDQVAEKGDVLGRLQEVHQTAAGTEEFRGVLAGPHGESIGRPSG